MKDEKTEMAIEKAQRRVMQKRAERLELINEGFSFEQACLIVNRRYSEEKQYYD